MNPIRYGMIGGGQGAFIGGVHRTAAAIAGNWKLVAGALSSTPEKAMASAAEIGLPKDRSYGSWQEMLEREAQLPEDQRIEAVAVVTPNHAHAAPAIAALEAGFAVIIDKPLADNREAAEAIAEAARRTSMPIAVTQTYTGYPLVKQARKLVASGELGAVRRVMVKYTQDWLSRASDLENNKQAEWRVDPARSGKAGAFGVGLPDTAAKKPEKPKPLPPKPSPSPSPKPSPNPSLLPKSGDGVSKVISGFGIAVGDGAFEVITGELAEDGDEGFFLTEFVTLGLVSSSSDIVSPW